jgi:histidinol-phosphate aminotransferase
MPAAPQLGAEAREDLLGRGYSRRDVSRIAAVFAGGALAARAGTPAWAAIPASAPAPAPARRLLLDSNECWTGPLEAGKAASRAILEHCNRYDPGTERPDFIKAVAAFDRVPEDHVSPWPGSSDPLSRAVVTFASPGRGIVTADPTFELAWDTAEWLGAPVRKVPLTADHRHDVKAMLAADPAPGLFYVCSPNNPTGTLTPLEDIAWLVRNKPAGSVVLVDEAYIHFSGTASATALFAESKDVLVLRTFSKLFGMAGMRMGYLLAHPEMIARMQRYDGNVQSGSLPMPSLVCATASLGDKAGIAARREDLLRTLAFTIGEVDRRGLKVVGGSMANMFMIDWRNRPAKEMREAFRREGVEIGRSWAIWPTASRITISSRAEMMVFLRALDRVLGRA